MRAPRTRRGTRRAGTVLLAGTLASALVIASGGAAVADDVLGDHGVYVGGDDPSAAYRQVFGLVDAAWNVAPTVDPVYVDGTEINPNDVQAWMGKVYGVVQDPAGTAMAGVTVIVELIPTQVPDGQQIAAELARTVTDELGKFEIGVPTTEAILKEAEYHNGNVNLWISAIKYEAESRGYAIWQGGGAVYSALAEHGGGVGGMAIAPVNVGVLTVGSAATGYGASLPSTPSDDPYAEDGTYVGDGSPSYGVLDPATGDVIADTPMVGSQPYVETPYVMHSTVVTTPPVHPTYPAFPTSPMPTPEGNEDPAGGDARCRHPRNQDRWLTDERIVRAKFQPVGEVHGWWGTKVNYEYANRAQSVVGARARYEGKKWDVSGSTTVSNDAKFTTTLGTLSSFAANPVEGEFNHFYVKETWCPVAYDGDRIRASHRERIYVAEWTGGLRYGGKTLGGDGHEEFKKARAEGRAMTMYQKVKFTKDSGKSYKFTAGVTAFGVGLDIQSSHSANHKMTLTTTDMLLDWHAWGNKGVPPSPENNAIYVSG